MQQMHIQVQSQNVHRCSMIKKYSMETFFSPQKQHKRATTVEASPVSGRAMFQPMNVAHPTNVDTSVYQPQLPNEQIQEEDDEQSVTEMVPEVASNFELGQTEGDETFAVGDETLKAD